LVLILVNQMGGTCPDTTCYELATSGGCSACLANPRCTFCFEDLDNGPNGPLCVPDELVDAYCPIAVNKTRWVLNSTCPNMDCLNANEVSTGTEMCDLCGNMPGCSYCGGIGQGYTFCAPSELATTDLCSYEYPTCPALECVYRTTCADWYAIGNGERRDVTDSPSVTACRSSIV